MAEAAYSSRLLASRKARPHGFTLVELLVALVIMALLALMSWRGLDAMLRASELNRSRSDRLGALHRGLQQWTSDLDGLARQYELPPQSGTSGTAGKPADAPVALDWNGQALRLLRSQPADPGAGLQVVAWAARAHDGQRTWSRWQSVPLQNTGQLQSAWQAAAAWAAAGSASSLGQSVDICALEDWQIYHYRGNSWSNALSSTEEAAGLPEGVRLVLQLPPDAVLQGRLTRDWLNPALTGGTQ